MANRLLNAEVECQDEIGRTVVAATSNWERDQEREQKYRALLPLEMASVEPLGYETRNVDRALADEYAVVDYSAIMSKMRGRFLRPPVPFFASYDIEDKAAECHIRYNRQDGSVVSVTSSSSMYHRETGIAFKAYPDASLMKMLKSIKNREAAMLGRGMAISGCSAALLAFVAATVLGAGWIVTAISTFLACGLASTFFVVFPGSDSDIVMTTKFAGVLPNEVRQKIEEVRSKFDCIAIVQDVDPKNWATTKVPKPRSADPLAIGFKKGIAYLICRFDTTPAEHYICSEFAAMQ